MRPDTISTFVLLLSVLQSGALAQPELTIEKTHHVGIADSLGFSVAGDDEFLVADTAGSHGSKFIWKITQPSDRTTGDPGQLMPAVVSAAVEFITLPLRQPAGLALSADEKSLYICDMGDRRIFVCDAETGALSTAFDTPGQPRAIRAPSDGSIWYLTTDGRLHHRDLNTGRTALLRDTQTSDPVHPIEFEDAIDFTFDPTSNTIFIIRSEAGEVIAISVDTGAKHTVAQNLSQPHGIEHATIGSDHYLIIAETGASRITLISLDDDTKTGHITPGEEHQFKSPMMVRRSSEQNRIFITATDANDDQPIIIELRF